MQEPRCEIYFLLVWYVWLRILPESCLRFYKRETTLHSNPCNSQRLADSVCRDVVMAYVGSILLAFLAFGYVTSAAPKLPFGSNLEEYPKDTLPLSDESSFQQLMDNMEEQPQEGPLHAGIRF